MSGVRTLRLGEAVPLAALSGRALDELTVRVTSSGAAPDVVALLLGPDGSVRDDRDLVFAGRPMGGGGAVAVEAATATARLRPADLKATVAKVLVGCAGGSLDSAFASSLRVDISRPGSGLLASAVVEVPPHHRAESVLEVYRRGAEWRLRVLGDGYAAGLTELVRDHGVRVDGAAPPPAAPTPAAPTPADPTPAGAPAVVSAPAPDPATGWAPMRVPSAAPAAWSPDPASTTTAPAAPRRRSRRRWVGAGVATAAVVAVAVALAAGGSDPGSAPTAAAAVGTLSSAGPPASATPSPTPTPTVLAAAAVTVVPATAAAQAQLALLPVKGRAPMTGYDRSQFGQAWADVDRNGCDTRNDVLRRDIANAVIDPTTSGCVVLSGTLADPYSATSIPFVRGETTSAAVQIDHVVALGDAWQTGAQQLDPTRREQFANDPANLLAVDGPLNAQKGDGDAATWLPLNSAYRCTYVAKQVQVKAAYGLWVTAAEHDAIAGILARCPGATVAPPTPTPTPTTPPPVVVTSSPAAAAPPPVVVATTPVPDPPPADDPGSVYYPNCAAARAAGVTPIYAGQPGYSRQLDRDGDGVACE